MSVPLILQRGAQAEFDDAADWYEGQSIGQGPAFTFAVREVFASIRTMPMAYPIVHEGVREALVHSYPYTIYYRFEPGRIRVLSVFHTSRDPREWRRRV